MTCAQNKLSLLEETAEKTTETVFSFSSKMLSSSLLSCVEGASPLICREIAEMSGEISKQAAPTKHSVSVYAPHLRA